MMISMTGYLAISRELVGSFPGPMLAKDAQADVEVQMTWLQ